MKTMIKRMCIATLLMLAVFVEVKAESTVYFFVDFRFSNPSYPIMINGTKAFSLDPKLWSTVGGMNSYYMCARKVTFKNEGTFVISTECPTPKNTILKAEINLNVEDGQTYYVLFNSNIKKTFYAEEMSEKDGLKLLKKAQSSKKYTINDDFVYEGK